MDSAAALVAVEFSMAHISGHDRSQMFLLPEAVDDYVDADNPVRFIDAFVDELDLTAAGFVRVEPKATGGSIHIHAAEQMKEVDESLAALGRRPVEWLLATSRSDGEVDSDRRSGRVRLRPPTLEDDHANRS